MKNVISNTFTITAQKPTVSVDHIDNFYIVEATGTQPAVDDSRWQFVEAGDPTPKTTPAAPYLWHKTITWLTDGTHLDPVVEFAGSMGQNGIDYDLVPSHSAIIKDENDNRTPANVTCALVKRNADGTADTQSTVPTGYSIKVTKDTTTSTYTLGSNVSTAGVSVIVFSLWYGAVEIERHTISVVAEGGQGVDGRGIQSQDYRFKATSSNSQPATPATAAQWNEWKALNAAGYSESVPYLWRCCRTVYVDGHGNTETEYIVDGPTVWGKNGNDSIVLDIDNEMDSIPADSTGKTLAAVVLTTNYRLYKGSTNITAQGTAPTVANIKIAGVTPVLTTNSEYVEVKWTIPAGTTLGAEKYIASIPVSYGGNTYRKDFTANVVKSGQPGVSPSIYQLLLSCTEVSFARNSSNVLTPSSVNVRCGYTKTTGATIEKHVGDKQADLQSIDSKYNILYRPIQANGNAGAWAWMKDLSSANFYLVIPNSTTYVAYEFVLTTAASASAVADSNIVDRETLPINKDGLNGAPGESAFVIDLDNDTDAFGTDSDGKISTAINRETKATMYYGVSPLTLTGLSATKTYEDGTACGSEVAVTTDTETGKVTVTMGSTSFAYKKTIFIDITGVCSRGSKTIRFTIQPQASGEPGVSPIIYQLMPTPSTLSFARNSSGSLIIENNVITCLVKRTEENDSTILSSLSGYNVFYGYGNVATPSNKINVGGTITVNASNAANYTQLVIELWKMNGNTKVTRLDRETIPITKEGQKGQKGAGGDEGNGIDTVTLARMFTTNFVQPSNTDSGWISEGASNYPTEAGLSDVNHYLWQRKKTTYTKSTNVTYEVVLFAQFIDGVHENLLDDTAFLSEGEMEAWDVKNGTIGQKSIGNHNSFGGTPVWENQYTELLLQKVYKYGTVQKLKPNTWYTLSFYGAMVTYQDLLSSSVYNGSDGGSYWQIGASLKSFCLDPGQSALITVTGRCYSTSVFLRVFGFRYDWGGGMTKSVDFTSTSSETKSFKLTNTGTSAALFRVCGYVYLTDGSETQNSYSDINHRAYITLIRLDRGCKLNTYLYRSDNGQAVQHSASAPWYVDGKKFTSRGSLQDSNTGHVVTVNGVQENVHDGTVVNFTDDGSVLWQMSAGTLRHSVTFKTPYSLSSSAEYRVLFRLAQYSHYGWISMPKLEEGTAATDWIESSNDRKAEDIQHVFVGNWVASTQGDKSTYYFFGGGTGVRHVVRARKSASGAYTYWRMKQRTTSEGYYSTAQPYNDTAHWEQADYLKFIAAEFALIDEAIIKFTQTNRILVYNSAGTVAAGMGGAPGGSNDFPLWVGASYENRANASFRVSLTGILYATGAQINGSIDATNITANSGKIAGFTLSGNGLTNIVSQSDMSKSSNMGYIICRNDYYGRFAGIGANVLPATSGLVSAVARFENTDSHSWYSTNIALLLRAENGQNNNFAFTGTGNGVLNGWVGGYKYSRFILTSTNTIYDGYVTLKENNVWFIKANVSNSGIALPKLSKVRDALGIGSSTNFCVRLLICADINSNQGFDIYGRNQKQSSSGTKTWNTDELPLMTHWDNSNWDTCPMGQGDSLELLLVYDSSRTETINGYSTKYTARIINRQD